MSAAVPLLVENLTFRYWRREEPAIRELNFSIQPGQVMLIGGAIVRYGFHAGGFWVPEFWLRKAVRAAARRLPGVFI